MQAETPNWKKRSSSSTRAKRRRTAKPGAAKDSARVEISAGGIVFQRRHDGPYLAFIRDAHGKWTFAKGHVRIAKGESLEAGALRETEEEMGMHGLHAIGKLGTTDIWFRDRFQHKGVLVHKFITYYLMEAPSGSRSHLRRNNTQEVAPGKEPPPEEIAWVTLADAENMPIYPNTVDMLKKALRCIRKLHVGRGSRQA